MAKHPTKKEADHAAEAGDVDATVAAPVTAPAAEPVAEPKKLIFSSTKPPALADLNSAAYTAHKADADLKRKATEAAVKAAQAVLSKINI